MSGDDLDVILRSYDEVLDATKHQDDKVGRFLTAIAFLTTGAISFATGPEVLDTRYDLDGAVHLPAVFLVAFFLLSLLTVLLLVLALGPNVSLPRRWAGAGSPSSRLFFLSISADAPAAWDARWRGRAGEERADLYASLPSEIHNIATKTDFKYGRTSEARAAFTMALVALALALTLGLVASIGDPTGAALAWSARPRGLAAGILAASALLLGYDWIRLDQSIDARLSPVLWPQTRSLYWFALAAAAFTGTVVALPLDGPAGAAVAVGTGLVALQALFRRYRHAPPQVGIAAVGAVVVAAGAVAAWSSRHDLGLAVGFVAVGLLELPRVLISTSSWRRRQRRYREATDVVEALLRRGVDGAVEVATAQVAGRRAEEADHLERVLARQDDRSVAGAVLRARLALVDRDVTPAQARAVVQRSLALLSVTHDVPGEVWAAAGVPADLLAP
jgi:hypothetical protein